MKRFFTFFLCFLVGLTLQLGARHFITPELRIDLSLLLVIYLGLTVSLLPGGLSVLLIGLATEVFASPTRGTLALSYLVIFFFLRMAQGRLFLEEGFSRTLWVILLVLLQKVTEAILAGKVAVMLSPIPFAAFVLLNGFVSLGVFPLWGKLDQLVKEGD